MSILEDNNEDYWIPLADIMTGLMIIFMLISVSFMLKVAHREAKIRSYYQQTTNQKVSSAQPAKQQIAEGLQKKLGRYLTAWNASFESKTLTLRFNAESVMFATGKSELTPTFKEKLTIFFPLYLETIVQHKNSIATVNIDGYSSSGWRNLSESLAYFSNMELSQKRATSVLYYLYQNQAINADPAILLFLRKYFTANGYSSSHIIFNPDGSENSLQSQRVEFKIILK